ncbi:DUF4383 domain-containing protein [soil metagenome]
MASAGTSSAKTPAQMFALVFGIVYLAIGVLGFFVTGFGDFFNKAGDTLILFPVNPMHNIVHLLLGAIWLGGSRAHATAKAANLGIGIAYLLFFLLGLFGALEWLAIESGINADQLLHLVSGAAGVYFGTAGAGVGSRRTATA